MTFLHELGASKHGIDVRTIGHTDNGDQPLIHKKCFSEVTNDNTVAMLLMTICFLGFVN